MTDARQALHELRDYFEQKRNLHIRRQEVSDEVAYQAEMAAADAYDHAMEMVATYIRELPK